MVIDNIILDIDLKSILGVLQSELGQRGISVFSVIKDTGDNLQTICPFHKGGHEKRPSFGINKETGACNCFACGWKGYLPYLISCLYGHPNSDEFGKSWLIHNFSHVSIQSRSGIQIPNRNTAIKNVEYVSDEELDKYRVIHPYMYKRGLSNHIIEMFDIGYDKETDSITFPVKDINGNTVFVARRAVRFIWFNYPSGSDKPVYGAYLFRDGNFKQCYITESFFNCLTLWKFRLPSVALMGTGSAEQYKILDNLPVREYVLALDPDSAGYKGMDKLRKNLSDRHLIRQIEYLDERDVNDLQEEFLNLKKLW
jgi:DNA primase